MDKIKEDHIIDDKEGYKECSSEELYNNYIDRIYQYSCIGWDGLICPVGGSRDDITQYAKYLSRSEIITGLVESDIREKYVAEWEGKYCTYSIEELLNEFSNKFPRWEWTLTEPRYRDLIIRHLKRYDKYGPYPWDIDADK